MIKVSGSNSPFNGQFYWYRVTSYTAGATIAVDQENPILIDCLETRISKRQNPWERIALTGTVAVELGDSEDERFPGPILG